jgi:excisionase family DNA binding protein
MSQDRLLRPSEIARNLSVSRSTIYRWYWEGKLDGIKLKTGSLRILESSVQAMVQEAW